MLEQDIWHPGCCAICGEVWIVAPFVAFPDDEDAPYFYACAKCFLERLDGIKRPATF